MRPFGSDSSASTRLGAPQPQWTGPRVSVKHRLSFTTPPYAPARHHAPRTPSPAGKRPRSERVERSSPRSRGPRSDAQPAQPLPTLRPLQPLLPQQLLQPGQMQLLGADEERKGVGSGAECAQINVTDFEAQLARLRDRYKCVLQAHGSTPLPQSVPLLHNCACALRLPSRRRTFCECTATHACSTRCAADLNVLTSQASTCLRATSHCVHARCTCAGWTSARCRAS